MLHQQSFIDVGIMSAVLHNENMGCVEFLTKRITRTKINIVKTYLSDSSSSTSDRASSLIVVLALQALDVLRWCCESCPRDSDSD